MLEQHTQPAAAGDGPPPRPLTEDVGWLLARSSHALRLAVLDRLAPFGVSLRGYTALSTAQRAVAEGRPLTQLALGRAICLDKSTMVVTLDELERTGLVAREPDPHDRRARVVAPTPAGRALLARAEAAVREVEAEALADLSEEERRTLLALLNRLVAGRLSAGFGGGSCL